MSYKYEDKAGSSGKGLGERFQDGEFIPLKKIMFKVVVKFDHIELWPVAYKKP